MTDAVLASAESHADVVARLAQLREPFRPEEIRYLPRVWCGACRDSKAGCRQHEVRRCSKCRNKITDAHIDLPYVGHAEATNRLLNVDPEWSWEPVAFDGNGLPQYDQNGGLWIRLTVCGVTRLGYGNAEGKRGGDAVKEIIGDAIRNAGMRFGMALDLWTSSDLEITGNGSHDEEQAIPSPRKKPKPAPSQRDFVAEAEQCATADCAASVYRDAQAAGSGENVLSKIKAIGIHLRKVEQAGAGDESQDEHAAAVAALRSFAAEQHISNADLDMQAHTALGASLDDVSAEAIWGLLNQLTTT